MESLRDTLLDLLGTERQIAATLVRVIAAGPEPDLRPHLVSTEAHIEHLTRILEEIDAVPRYARIDPRAREGESVMNGTFG